MAVHAARGMRDFLPAEARRRNRFVQVVSEVFERHAFAPLVTPAVERIETLLGKYGEEGDRLIFRILKRGEGGRRGEVDLALRYDLTVPLARVVATHPDLPMPFKRYQVAPVWRADRPQKGRYREFVQCDVDTVGTDSRLADAEVLAVLHHALVALGIPDARFRLNHRRLLGAVVGAIGAAEREREVLVAVDKLDKVGREGVGAELERRGLEAGAIARLWDLLDAATPGELAGALGDHEEAHAVALELEEVRAGAIALGADPERLVFDPTLARGLDYYTGPVFEAVVPGGGFGSIAGGGRYDDLVGMFAGRRIPAVGGSLGMDRILALLEARGNDLGGDGGIDAYVTVFDRAEPRPALELAARLRAAGLRCELALVGTGLRRQMRRAAASGARWAVIQGPDELAAGELTLKHLETGEQERLPLDRAIARMRQAGG